MSSTGVICETTIKDKSIKIKIRDRIDALLQLLLNPNPDSPYNGDAANLYESSYH